MSDAIRRKVADFRVDVGRQSAPRSNAPGIAGMPGKSRIIRNTSSRWMRAKEVSRTMHENSNEPDSQAVECAKQAVIMAILTARSADDVDAPVGSNVDPLSEPQRLEVMTHVAGALTQIIVSLRAGVPGVAEGLDTAAALYTAEMIIDRSLRGHL